MKWLLTFFLSWGAFWPVYANQQSLAYPVLIELFTSQGCSSCPPADYLLNKLQEIGIEKQLPIHVVSWHVDYWNHLGWRDPLSKPEFTNYQKAYTKVLEESNYTPQMVINGRYIMIGSDVDLVEQYLNKSLAEPNSVTVGLKVARVNPKIVTLRYELEGFWQDKDLVVALVRYKDEINVAGGENMGRKLLHVNSARHLMRIDLKKAQGMIEVPSPPLKQLAEYRVIAWVQDPALMEVSGVASVALPEINT